MPPKNRHFAFWSERFTEEEKNGAGNTIWHCANKRCGALTRCKEDEMMRRQPAWLSKAGIERLIRGRHPPGGRRETAGCGQRRQGATRACRIPGDSVSAGGRQ